MGFGVSNATVGKMFIFVFQEFLSTYNQNYYMEGKCAHNNTSLQKYKLVHEDLDVIHC
jgi:hypothetical protein